MHDHPSNPELIPGDAWVRPDVFTRYVTFIMGEEAHAGDMLSINLADGCVYRATDRYDLIAPSDCAKGEEVSVVLDLIRKRNVSINVATWDREYLWHYRASLLRVIDGDTIVVITDNGFYGRHEAHIRLANVYARELSAYGGKADREKLIRAVSGLPDGWNLRIITTQKVTIISETTSFERYVGNVCRADTGENIADILSERSLSRREDG